MPATATEMTAIRYTGNGTSERQQVAADHSGHRNILWVTETPSNVPDGCTHLDPVEGLDDGVFDELDDPHFAGDTAIIIDDDGLNAFDVADRMHITIQARKAAAAIRLLQR